MITVIIFAIVKVFGFFAVGIAGRLTGYVKEESINEWSRFAIDFLYLFLIFDSITQNLDRKQLFAVWPLPVIGFGAVFLGFCIGMLMKAGLLTGNKDIKKTFVHFCAINNSSYLPIVIAGNLWGGTAVANLFLLNLGTTVGLWTIGIVVLQTGNPFRNIKNLLCGNLIMVLVSTLLVITGLNRFLPSIMMQVCNSVGSMAVPLILTLTGATFADRRNLHINWQVVYVTIVRLIIFPLCTIPVLKLLPLTKDVYQISVIVCLMPVAVSSVLLIRRYGGHPEYASSTALVSTISALITVPIAIWILF